VGLLIFKGMKVGIQDGDFTVRFNENGTEDSNLTLSTSFNMLPIWLKIAYENIVSSNKASKAVSEKWCEDNEIQKSLLVAELTPSIQVFVACGCALDAFYDQLKEYANISQNDLEIWKRKKTSRTAQIVEIIRRTYKLDKHFVKGAKVNIKSIMEYRDKVVHPSHDIQHTRSRPDIPVGVDWRFSAYKYSNALIAYQRTMELLILLYERKSDNDKVNQNMETIFESLIELGLVSKMPNKPIKQD
jgi:hypothetical protein